MIDKDLVKVGDIVVTHDNGIGYVSKVYDCDFMWTILKPREIEDACATDSEVWGDYDSPVYKQIGMQFVSSKTECTNEIKPLSEDTRLLSEIRDKLNEVIRYVNNINMEN